MKQFEYHDVVVIEDSHDLLNKKIKIREGNLFVGPINIQEAEEWEKRLNRIKEPYVLVQAETVIPVRGCQKDGNLEDKDLRLAKGYFLFVETKTPVKKGGENERKVGN